MIKKRTIDLLEDDEGLEIPSDMQINKLDDTFTRQDKQKDQKNDGLSTQKKFLILDWDYINRQLKSYGSNKVDDISLNFIPENDREHIKKADSEGEFDFSSDSAPFSAKYNIAFALSYSEAINILTNTDDCEIYASEEVKSIFEKYNIHINSGLNKINFANLPLDMRKELVWPTIQNLYRASTIRKAAQIFPEGVPGKIAYEAMMSECKNEQLAIHLSRYSELKISDYDIIFFNDPSDLEIKYHIASYCLDHIRHIKRMQNPEQEEPEEKQEEKDNDEKKEEESEDNEKDQKEAIKNLENEYISAFKRLNKDKSFWDKINFGDILQMGKDVIDAIKEEATIFNKLRQEIMYRFGGRSKIVIEDEELARIIKGQNPNFDMASQYLMMFFQPSDYYRVLGLSNSKNVTEKEVKDAFKKLAKIYHPDKNPDDPYKEEKEQRFKLMLEAKDAILKKLKTGKDSVAEFRDDVSLTSYLGSISKLFDGYEKQEDSIDQYEYTMPQQEENNQEDIINMENMTDEISHDEIDNGEYLGPYFEEMRILSSLADGWKGKEILVLGAGSKPDDFSIPVILTKLGADVTAIDINYSGPDSYKGCKYIRESMDRADQIFEGRQFDILISASVFGVPFTNWAIRQYAMNPFKDDFTEKILKLELEILEKLAKITKKGGWQFHYNKDMNPQSWNFTEDDLKKIGYESAFHPENHPNSKGIWFIKA